ncbi:polysaccharide deacetylase family protein [Paenibacillus kobensis]|uniref:polysaccharide deacetylase family protein n=1 Tax=Paenibacillus kobensis TaxID=59841 RepID=UPI000FDBE083|nr:polysaccharide deacetylase family protein [Paenibacillus kobensis]
MKPFDVTHRVQTQHKAVAFTFDDGPNPVYTPQVLDIFREVGGKATFYMIGEQIEKEPELAALVHAQGHEIGNHTYTHPFLTKLSGEAVRNELRKSESMIQDITGKKPVTLRTPYFDVNEEVLSIIEEEGYQLAAGAVNMAAQDWDMPGVDHIVEKTRESVCNGGIFIFHDGFGDRSQSIEAVRVLAKELTKSGYRLVTVEELLTLADPE